MAAPAPDTCGHAQHGQHQRIVQWFLHGREHVPHRGVQHGQTDTEQQLALPVQAGAPHKAEPARHHKKQVAVQKGILPTEDQPRDGVQVKHRRPPGGKTADLGMGLVKAKIALRRAVGHDCRKLLDVVDLVAPRAGGQVDPAKRHAVDEPLIQQ